MEIHPITNHSTLPDMPSSTITDHTGFLDLGGTRTMTGSLKMGIFNISGSDIDINAGTGNFVTTEQVKAARLVATDKLFLLDSGTGGTFLQIKALDAAFSANRLLSIDLGNEARTLTFTGGAGQNPTISDWFDQSVKILAEPTFGVLTLAGAPPGLIIGNGSALDFAIKFDASTNGFITFDESEALFQLGTSIGGVDAKLSCGAITSLANIFTLGNDGAADDSVMWWKSSGEDGRITFDQSDNTFQFGLTAGVDSAKIKCNTLDLSSLRNLNELTSQVVFSGTGYTFFAASATGAGSVISALTVSANVFLGQDFLAINEAGDDVDFRVEGLNDTHLIFTEGSTDRVGIGTATPAVKFDVVGVSRFGDSSTNYTEISATGDILPKGSAFLVFEKASGNGIKVDQTTPTFGFADLLGDQFSKNTGGTKPTLVVYNGDVDAWQFSNGDEAFMSYHIPHDYVLGTDIFLHIHWSQNAAGATGGTIDFKYFAIYAKGHNQASGSTFTSTPITDTFTSININDGGSGLNQYQQHFTEVIISGASATAALFDRDDFEPDGVIELTLEMDADNLTGTPSSPFIHYVDIHYQTTGLIGTKAKAPDFYA